MNYEQFQRELKVIEAKTKVRQKYGNGPKPQSEVNKAVNAAALIFGSICTAIWVTIAIVDGGKDEPYYPYESQYTRCLKNAGAERMLDCH
jgi:hypothetical protein